MLEARQLLAPVTDWTYRGVGGGGSLFGPAINPHAPNQLFISSDMSQMFQSSNGGASWDTISFLELQGGSKSQVQFTSDPNIFYVIDGSTDGANDATRPAKSIDGGTTWNQLPADPTFAETFSLRADYANPNRLLVGNWNELFFSSDGGASFTQKFSTNDSAGLHLAGAFFHGSSIYVGTNLGLLVSNNNGDTFQIATLGGLAADERMVSFAGAHEAGTTRLYIVTMDATDVWNGVPGSDHFGYRSIYRLDVGDTQWTSITAGIASDADGFFVAAPLDDIDTVYMAGGDGLFPIVYKSVNGGGLWSSVLQTANNANVQTGWSGSGGDHDWWYGENAMGFTVDPIDANRAIITDLGFAHMTVDGGVTWFNLNVIPEDLNPAGQNTPPKLPYHGSGLENTSAWDLTWTSPTRIIASQSDISGTVSSDGGQSWSFDYTGHDQNSMYGSFKHTQSGIVYAATSTIHDLFQSTRIRDNILDPGSGKVVYSNDDGHSWQTLHDFGKIVSWVAEDPTQPNRLYASVVHSTQGGIYVSNNIQNGPASTWTRLTSPPRTEGHAFNIRVLDDGTLVASFSARMNSSSSFTASSGVFLSNDGGQTWSDRSHPDMQYWTKDVVIDPHDPTQSTWYAAVWSGWGGPANDRGGLFRTTDRGQSWQRLSSAHRMSSVTISPTDANEMYATTEVQGLWHTDNLSSANPTFERVEGYPFRQPERVFYNPYDTNEIWIVSFGGSLAMGRLDANDGDFNDDGVYDTLDIDALTEQIAAQTNSATFDLTHDGLVNLADRDAWLAEAALALGFASPIRLGDANLDGVVDGQDFIRWNSNKFTPNTAWSKGNFNADSVVDGQDFIAWNSNRFNLSFASRVDRLMSANPRRAKTDQVEPADDWRGDFLWPSQAHAESP